MLHVTGYGRGRPASDRPGFGTLAEAMSGFAAVTGEPHGPPTLPPFMLADGVAAQAATYAVMMALYHRDMHAAGGQLVDISLVEPLARLVEQATLAYDQLGVVNPAPVTGSTPARRATPIAPATTSGSRYPVPHRVRRRRCTGRSKDPTWQRFPPTSTRYRASSAPRRSIRWSPSGSAGTRSMRP